MFRKLLLALAIAVLPIAGAHALGLGGISLQSRLNEPLDAEIALQSVDTTDLEKLRVGLASSEEFEQAGLDRPFTLAGLSFETVQRGGRTVIKVTTREAFREPFLSFLVKVEWPNGRLLREYTLLLDPPVVTREAAPAVQAPAAQAAPQMAPAAPTASTAPARSAPTPRAASAPRVSSVGGGEYRVQRGDNLYSIARETLDGTGVSSQQAMLAFLRANPEAFIDNNINLIKEGYVLRVPSAQEALTVNQAEAVADVRRQMAEWRTYRQARAGGSEQPGAAMAAAPQARLEVVAPAGGDGTAADEAAAEPGSSAEVEQIQKELALATEAAEARRLENEELRDHVAELEEKLAEMQRLVTVKVDELAALQARLKEAGEEGAAAGDEMAPGDTEMAAGDTEMAAGGTEMAAGDTEMAAGGTEAEEASDAEGEAAAPTAEAEAEQPAISEAQSDAVDPSDTAQAPTAAQEAPEPETVAEAEQATQTRPAAAEPVPQASFQPPAAEPAGPMGFLEDFLGPGVAEDPVMLGGIGGGILLLVLLLVLMMRRRGAAAEGPQALEPSLAAAGDAGAAADEPTQASDSFLDTAANMEVTDFEEPEGAEQSAEAASGVDQVIAEADVYLAYGRYQQAEELIKGSIDENPGRTDLQQKLLEVYFATRDREAFEALSQELHSTLEAAGGSEWDKYQLMGKDLCPDNPLFAGAAGAATGEVEGGVPSGALDTGIDFDPFAESAAAKDETTDEPPADELEDISQALEFELGDSQGEGEPTQEIAAETVIETGGEEDDEDTLDFDFDFGEGGEEENLDLEGTLPLGAEPEEDETSEPESEEMDLTLDTADGAARSDEDDLSLDFDIGEDETSSSEFGEEKFDLTLDTIQTESEAIEKAIEAESAEPSEDVSETQEERADEESSASTPEGEPSSMMEDRDFSIEWDITGMGLDADEEETTPSAGKTPEEEAAREDLESTAILDFTSVPLDEESSSEEDADMVATKLDLAKAYIDMGDSDGARNILDEVANEGNESQRREAENLLGQL